MNYDRMKAKKIPGEHCRFCGDSTVPLVKTRCCNQWICCDTARLSFRGGGFCQDEHERYSMCHFHYQERHAGDYKECKECSDFWEKEYRTFEHGSRNKPKYDKPRDRVAAKLDRDLFNGT